MANEPKEQSKAATGPRQIDATVLFGDSREVILEHDGQHYRLRITASGKLILTK